MASSAVLTATATTATAPAKETSKVAAAAIVEAAGADVKSVALATVLEDEDCKDDDVLTSSLRSCANDPDFAVICAFLQKFATDLDINLPNFKHMQEWLTNTDEVNDSLRDMHIKLLRKIRKSVQEKNWETALSKFCFSYSAQDGWEVERFGYKKSSLKVKLHILRELLECQFERNMKFRNKFLTLDADSLRSQPIGRDRLGHTYWLTQDDDSNLRIYQEHLDEEIWQVVATNRDEFVNLIARLRGNEVVLPSTDIGVIDEDTSSSNSCAAPIEKPPPPEEQDDSQEEEAKVPNLRIKLGGNTAPSVSSAVDVGKGEEELAAEEDAKLQKKKLATVIKLSAESIVKDDDDDDGDDDEDEEEEEIEEEGEEEYDEEDDTEAENDDEKPVATAKGLTNSTNSKTENAKSAAPEAHKKVKPLLISQAKITASSSTQNSILINNNGTKKRNIDELDKSSSGIEDLSSVKKSRPTLLDSKREKKPSRYEKVKSEDEEDDDEDDEEEEVGEEEDDEDIEEGEEEDIDSAAAEEDENEEKDIEDDDDEVGEAIEDPPIMVQGEGYGKMCDGANPTEITTFFEENAFLLTIDDGDSTQDPEISEEIEEELLYISGEGCGAECLVGNTKNEEPSTTPTDLKTPASPTTSEATNPPKATFFFGEPGCLKLSPIKKTSSKEEAGKVDEEDSDKTTEDDTGKLSVDEKCNSVEQSQENSEVEKTISNVEQNQNEKKNGSELNNISEFMNDEKPENAGTEILEKSEIGLKEINEIPEKLATNGSPKIAEDIETNGKDKAEIIKEVTTEEENKNQNEDTSEKKETELLDQNNVVINEPESVENVRNNEEVENGTVNINLKETENLKNTLELDDKLLKETKTVDDSKDEKNIPHEALKETNEKALKEPPDTLNLSLNKSISDLPLKSSLKTSPTPSTTMNIFNRKRRLTDLLAAEKTAPRLSTSESELELNYENQYEAQAGAAEDEVEDVEDVGGKRLKMRPKLTNFDIRKKVEAQKIAIEETTSSSGEEDARRRRKIISPKRQWIEKPYSEEVKKNIEESEEVQTESNMNKKSLDNIKVSAAVVPSPVSSNVKAKISLAEIIEKKLKKNSEPPISECATPTSSSSVVVAAPVISPTKKIPITKPLKKNLLTQLRQEESDEETIPRKRTISENFNQIAEKEMTPDPLDISEMDKDAVKAIKTQDRKTPERQRKRRSSAEIIQPVLPGDNEEEYVVEKLKKSVSDEQIEKTLDSSNLSKSPAEKISSISKSLETIEEKVKPEEIKIKTEIERETTPPATVGRRSSRRGAATVIYAELPEPKRTRGIKSATTISTPKVKKEPAKSKDVSQPKSKGKSPDIKKPTSIVSKDSKQLTKIDDIKIETTESKTAVKRILKEEKCIDETVTPNSDLKNKTVTTPKSSTGTPKTGVRKKREVDTVNILENVDSEAPVRMSRRIAQQKIKEEAERRKLEEIALRTMKNELKKKKKAEAKADPTVAAMSDHSISSSSDECEEEAKKSKKKKCPGKDGTWSSGSEEQEEPEEEEEDPIHLDSDAGSPLFKSDHEFSPESELEDESQVVPMKRARTARKEDAEGETDDEEEACQKCGKSDHPEWILLCDSCDKGYHCSCLSPVLFYIPEGDWHCPPCQQEQLIAALEKKLQEFDDLVEIRKRKELENKRLAQEAELAAKERQLEEKTNKKKKNDRNDRETGESSEDEDSDNDSTHSGKKRKDDNGEDEKKSIKRDKKSKKNADEKSKRRRDGGGSSRRRRRRAATRGARMRRRNASHSFSSSGSEASRSGSKSGSESNTDSSSSSSSATDSDDEPIYKLRKRRQINVSYRLNEYDDLIDSALRKQMGEAAVVGSLGRGKDISTIIEADKEHQVRQKQGEAEEKNDKSDDDDSKINKEEIANNKEALKPEEEVGKTSEAGNDSEDEPIKRKVKVKANQKKKSRKLTTLDISSEDDNASDEDFKTSSFDEDEEEDTSISASNSDSSLEVYRRRSKGSKKTRKAARRAARERRKDRKFLVDDSEEEEEARPKSKKKRKDDSDYTETEEELSELSENVDSADLCDDSSSSDNSDGAWRPSKRKKQRKSNAKIARKSPKLKKAQAKKPKRVEYSDDDISEDEEEDYDDDDDIGGGKGSGKQPRSVPLKSTSGKGKGKGKGGGGTGKSSKTTAGKKKKKNLSDYDDESISDSDDSNRRTRGRRYAYLDDFEDDSSDGGIKPGVHRPDTPPEEREKFIKRQEEIKRMLAEKNAEGAKLAATPRLTPIKGAGEKGTRSPAKPGDSLSTVPLSVIRQAKVLDIDYLQRKGESVSDVDNVDDVDDDEFDDADLPDDFPEDMDEDAIARMVEEEEELVSAAAVRELPAPDEVLKTTPSKLKTRESEKPPVALSTNPSLAALSQIPTTSVGPSTSASGLQEPMRKRLPMPTMHPPLLRHQFHGGHPGIPPHMLHRQPGPPTHLLQNALSAPLGQPIHRNFPQHGGMPPRHAMPPRHTIPLRHGTPPRHSLPPHLLPPSQQQLAASQQLLPSTAAASVALSPNTSGAEPNEPKPRGRRKKITPLRDPLQKQQAAAAATAAAAVQSVPTPGAEKPDAIRKTEVNTGVIKSTPTSGASSSLGIAQPPQLYKPSSGSNSGVASVITRMPHLPPHGGPPPGRAIPPGPPGMYAGGDVTRFYGPPGAQVTRQPPGSGAQRHRGGPPIPVMPQHQALRPSYGPPPLRGVPVTGSQPPPGTVSNPRAPYPPASHGEHHAQSPTGPYGPPPPARHAAPHMNQYRPTFGNPNYPPRGLPPGQNLRTSGLGPEYHPGQRPYAPYGYYPPPPPLTTGHPHSSAHPSPSVHPPRSLHPVPPTTHAPTTTQPSQTHPPASHVSAPVPNARHAVVPSSVIVTAPPSNLSSMSVAPPSTPPISNTNPILPETENHATRVICEAKSAPADSPPPASVTATSLVKNDKSSGASVVVSETDLKSTTVIAVPSISANEPRSKKLITLETYATTKSPLAIGGESSGSRSSPNVQPDAANDSSSTPAATSPRGVGSTENETQGASEFSGLVSYFSSQHDDYNT